MNIITRKTMHKNDSATENNILEQTNTPNALSSNKKVCSFRSEWKFPRKQYHFNSQSDMEKPIENALIQNSLKKNFFLTQPRF